MTTRRLGFLLGLLALPMAAQPAQGIGTSTCPDQQRPATPSGTQQPGQTQAQLGACEGSSTGPWCEGNALRNTTAEHLTIHSFIRSMTPLSDRNDANLHVSWECPMGAGTNTQMLIEIRYTPQGTPQRVIRKSVECKRGTFYGAFPHSRNLSLTSFQAVGRLHQGDRNCLSTDFVALSVRLPHGVVVKPTLLAAKQAVASFSTIAEFGWVLKTIPSQLGFPQPTLPLRNREVIFDFSTCSHVNIEFKSSAKSKSPPSTFRLFY